MKYFLIVTGLVFFINGGALCCVSNINTGLILTVLIGLFFFAWGIFYEKVRELTQKGVLRVLKILVIVAVCFEACLVSYVAIIGEIDSVTYDEDALIVLGAGLRGDRVTLPLKARLDKALEYHKENPDALIIVSGGQGVQETVTEAYAMKKYLVEHGVPQDLVVEEDKATSTSENMKYSRKILVEKYGDDVKIAFVTNNFHVFRSKQLAKSAGFKDVSHIHTSLQWYNYIPNYLRETLAIFKMWILKY